MNILFVISSLQIGGEQRALKNLSQEFVANGNKVEIYVLSEKTEKRFDFDPRIIIHYHCHKGNGKNFKRIFEIRSFIKNGNFDVIIGFAVIPSILCSLARIKTKVPAIICERNDPAIYGLKLRIIRRIAYKFCNAGIFQTKDASNYFHNIKNRIVIPNPVTKYLPSFYHGIREKSIITTSRFTKAKNLFLLVETFAELYDNHKEYKLEMYGDGPEKQHIRNYINSKKLENVIFLYDATPDILEIIKNKEIFVLPSIHEGFPNSLLEAMSLGLACISTNCRIGGPNELITDHINGSLIKVNNKKELSSSLNELMSNQGLIEKYRNNCIKIRDIYNIDTIVDKWLDFIYDVVRRGVK